MDTSRHWARSGEINGNALWAALLTVDTDEPQSQTPATRTATVKAAVKEEAAGSYPQR